MPQPHKIPFRLSSTGSSPKIFRLPPSQPRQPTKFHRPVRDGRRFMGGHFEPNVLKQMKWLAVEEDTTTQKLLEEAIDLLFLKKGRGKIISG